MTREESLLNTIRNLKKEIRELKSQNNLLGLQKTEFENLYDEIRTNNNVKIIVKTLPMELTTGKNKERFYDYCLKSDNKFVMVNKTLLAYSFDKSLSQLVYWNDLPLKFRVGVLIDYYGVLGIHISVDPIPLWTGSEEYQFRFYMNERILSKPYKSRNEARIEAFKQINESLNK